MHQSSLPRGTPTERGADHGEVDEGRLAILKTLGDNTRYAIYLEIARSARPLSTSEVADSLELHVNTVRPHLERMRDLDLLVVQTEARGTVGRPQHRYALSPEAPSLGLEPPSFPVLAGLLLTVATEAGADSDLAMSAGRDHGRDEARTWESDTDAIDGLIAQSDDFGFDPAAVDTPGGCRVAFTHCPFRELAEANPDLVCGLHRGMVEGFITQLGGAAVDRFNTLADREPCLVELTMMAGE